MLFGILTALENYWMAVAGDGGAAATGAPTVTSQAAVNDEYDVVRVEIGADGKCDVYLGCQRWEY